MVFTVFSIIGSAWSTYENFGTIKKLWSSFKISKDYFILKYKNPEIFVSLEKIYFVEKPSKEAMEKIGDRILTDLNTVNGIKAIENGFEFELTESHIRYSIEEKEISAPGNKHFLVVLKTDTKLFYPFRQRSILRRFQSEFYKLSEIISSAYNFDKSNEIIKMELNIEGIDKKSIYKYPVMGSEVIYKNKNIQINTTHQGDNYPLIVTTILLWHLRFPEAKFVKKEKDY